MTIDLNQCDKACFGCIKSYKKKHVLKPGQNFEIECNGIPADFIPSHILAGLPPGEHLQAKAMLDPVEWAAATLDWHCLDEDGSIWKRKNPDEYALWQSKNPGKEPIHKSRYWRPYQAEMLRCSALQVVARIGRQVGKTESLVIKMLFNAFTKPGRPENEGFKIIVITPFQAQIDMIFERLTTLIKTSPVIQNSIKRNVKAPNYTIELHNGSMIKGFTAGTKSGGNANAVRGQSGHMLVFDEADYLSSGDMDSALSIITNNPGAVTWMSSTPSGKRDKFYQTCHSKLWKEFYYPSHVNPMFDERKDKSFKEQLTAIGYKHEVLADFGEQEEGVFQNSYVQAARKSFKYGEYAYHHAWKYTVGVDWNDTKNGTTIAVLGLDPTRNKFVLVDRYIVSREGWTQLSACQKIAEVNRLWNPMAIYLDAGFGGTQWEVLRKFGFDAMSDPAKGPAHPDS
jgi:replicative DNA helicase